MPSQLVFSVQSGLFNFFPVPNDLPSLPQQKCKMISESKEEMAVAKPHVSDDEDEEKMFAGGALKENKGISFSLNVRALALKKNTPQKHKSPSPHTWPVYLILARFPKM